MSISAAQIGEKKPSKYHKKLGRKVDVSTKENMVEIQWKLT